MDGREIQNDSPTRRRKARRRRLAIFWTLTSVIFAGGMSLSVLISVGIVGPSLPAEPKFEILQMLPSLVPDLRQTTWGIFPGSGRPASRESTADGASETGSSSAVAMPSNTGYVSYISTAPNVPYSIGMAEDMGAGIDTNTGTDEAKYWIADVEAPSITAPVTYQETATAMYYSKGQNMLSNAGTSRSMETGATAFPSTGMSMNTSSAAHAATTYSTRARRSDSTDEVATASATGIPSSATNGASLYSTDAIVSSSTSKIMVSSGATTSSSTFAALSSNVTDFMAAITTAPASYSIRTDTSVGTRAITSGKAGETMSDISDGVRASSARTIGRSNPGVIISSSSGTGTNGVIMPSSTAALSSNGRSPTGSFATGAAISLSTEAITPSILGGTASSSAVVIPSSVAGAASSVSTGGITTVSTGAMLFSTTGTITAFSTEPPMASSAAATSLGASTTPSTIGVIAASSRGAAPSTAGAKLPSSTSETTHSSVGINEATAPASAGGRSSSTSAPAAPINNAATSSRSDIHASSTTVIKPVNADASRSPSADVTTSSRADTTMSSGTDKTLPCSTYKTSSTSTSRPPRTGEVTSYRTGAAKSSSTSAVTYVSSGSNSIGEISSSSMTPAVASSIGIATSFSTDTGTASSTDSTLSDTTASSTSVFTSGTNHIVMSPGVPAVISTTSAITTSSIGESRSFSSGVDLSAMRQAIGPSTTAAAISSARMSPASSAVAVTYDETSAATSSTTEAVMAHSGAAVRPTSTDVAKPALEVTTSSASAVKSSTLGSVMSFSSTLSASPSTVATKSSSAAATTSSSAGAQTATSVSGNTSPSADLATTSIADVIASSSTTAAGSSSIGDMMYSSTEAATTSHTGAVTSASSSAATSSATDGIMSFEATTDIPTSGHAASSASASSITPSGDGTVTSRSTAEHMPYSTDVASSPNIGDSSSSSTAEATSSSIGIAMSFSTDTVASSTDSTIGATMSSRTSEHMSPTNGTVISAGVSAVIYATSAISSFSDSAAVSHTTDESSLTEAVMSSSIGMGTSPWADASKSSTGSTTSSSTADLMGFSTTAAPSTGIDAITSASSVSGTDFSKTEADARDLSGPITSQTAAPIYTGATRSAHPSEASSMSTGATASTDALSGKSRRETEASSTVVPVMSDATTISSPDVVHTLSQSASGVTEDSPLYGDIPKPLPVVTSTAVGCIPEAKEILDEGGSAVDAAIATHLCAGLDEPHGAGIGGGFYIIVYNETSKESFTVDGREAAPVASATDGRYETDPTYALEGAPAMAVPGEVAGLHAAWRQFGRLPWERLFNRTISRCEEGLAMSRDLVNHVTEHSKALGRSAAFSEEFFNEGSLPGDGMTLRRRRLCRTLRRIVADPKGFYAGDLADDILHDVTDEGGSWNSSDLSRYEARLGVGVPFHMPTINRTLLTPYLPSLGASVGLTLVLADALAFAPGDLSREAQNTSVVVRTMHRIVEALKHGIAMRNRYGDPTIVIPTRSGSSVDKLAKQFFGAQAVFARMWSRYVFESARNPFRYIANAYYADTVDIKDAGELGGVHTSVIDESGLAVAASSSIGLRFGSKRMGRRTGIIFNSAMADFSKRILTTLLIRANWVAATARPSSTLVPTIVVDRQSGSVQMVIGGGGGTPGLAAVAQAILNVQRLGMNLSEAIAYPRFNPMVFPHVLEYEASLGQEYVAGLKNRGHPMRAVGSTQVGYVAGLAKRSDGQWDSCSDPRPRSSSMSQTSSSIEPAFVPTVA